MIAKIEHITGHYGHFDIDGTMHRIYWEEAGRGIPLVCLHTAGSDSRQYRAILNDPEITRHFRVLAFDLPYHGKSSPPSEKAWDAYELKASEYMATIISFIDGLNLERPIVMGCSIGGRVILHLARDYPNRFRAFLGLQSSPDVPPYYDVDWLHRHDVHGGEICGAIAYGLMAPTSPNADMYETMWHYMQSGPGVFKGDLHFYKWDGRLTDHDIEFISEQKTGPIVLMSGAYDYSATLEDAKELASKLSAQFIPMPELGHFPMSENPEIFLTYLRPVLKQLQAQ